MSDQASWEKQALESLLNENLKDKMSTEISYQIDISTYFTVMT